MTESVQVGRINDIEDDNLYDSLLAQMQDLYNLGEISFGSAEPFGVVYNAENGELLGASWLETSGVFSPHFIINPKHRRKGYSRLLIDDLMNKYEQMKSYMGDDYKFVVNAVNEMVARIFIRDYGFNIVDKNDSGGVTVSN